MQCFECDSVIPGSDFTPPPSKVFLGVVRIKEFSASVINLLHIYVYMHIFFTLFRLFRQTFQTDCMCMGVLLLVTQEVLHCGINERSTMRGLPQDYSPGRLWHTPPRCAGVPQGHIRSSDPASRRSPTRVEPERVHLELCLCL